MYRGTAYRVLSLNSGGWHLLNLQYRGTRKTRAIAASWFSSCSAPSQALLWVWNSFMTMSSGRQDGDAGCGGGAEGEGWSELYKSKVAGSWDENRNLGCKNLQSWQIAVSLPFFFLTIRYIYILLKFCDRCPYKAVGLALVFTRLENSTLAPPITVRQTLEVVFLMQMNMVSHLKAHFKCLMSKKS